MSGDSSTIALANCSRAGCNWPYSLPFCGITRTLAPSIRSHGVSARKSKQSVKVTSNCGIGCCPIYTDFSSKRIGEERRSFDHSFGIIKPTRRESRSAINSYLDPICWWHRSFVKEQQRGRSICQLESGSIFGRANGTKARGTFWHWRSSKKFRYSSAPARSSRWARSSNSSRRSRTK